MFLGYNMYLSFLYVPIDHLRRGGGRAANGSILAALGVAAPPRRYCKKMVQFSFLFPLSDMKFITTMLST
jgi:hypothetical protein